MKKEYKEKLDKMYKFFNNYKSIPDEELHERCMNDFCYIADELVLTKNQEVLECLLDFFEEEFDYEAEGVLEGLKNGIGANYTLDQILAAFYKKFDSLIKNDIEICVEISQWYFYDKRVFENFRKMFNTVKSKKSEAFLTEFRGRLDEKVAILREDMKSW